jgi:hypothetical protein
MANSEYIEKRIYVSFLNSRKLYQILTILILFWAVVSVSGIIFAWRWIKVYVRRARVFYFKRVWHEIFDLRFFHE